MTMPELAHALGISLTHCYRHRRLGMPTDSVESALRWRKVSLDPARVHGGRVDRPGTHPAPALEPRPADDDDHTRLWIALKFAPENLSRSVACWVKNGDYPDRLHADLTALLSTIRDCLNRLTEDPADS